MDTAQFLGIPLPDLCRMLLTGHMLPQQTFPSIIRKSFALHLRYPKVYLTAVSLLAFTIVHSLTVSVIASHTPCFPVLLPLSRLISTGIQYFLGGMTTLDSTSPLLTSGMHFGEMQVALPLVNCLTLNCIQRRSVSMQYAS